MKFSYLKVETSTAEIDIEDIGNFALEAYTDTGECYILIVDTLLGKSRVFTYGPFIPEEKVTDGKLVTSIEYYPFSPFRLQRQINNVINNPKATITQVNLTTREEALKLCDNLVDIMNITTF